MVRKFWVFVVIAVLVALPLPLVHSANDERIPERLTALEVTVKWISDHIAQHADDLARSQGAQDANLAKLEERIRNLEDRDAHLSAFGMLGGFILTVLLPLGWKTYSDRHRALMRRVKAFEVESAAHGWKVSPEAEE